MPQTLTDEEIDRLAPVVARHSEEQFRMQARHDREKAALMAAQLAERVELQKEAAAAAPPAAPK